MPPLLPSAAVLTFGIPMAESLTDTIKLADRVNRIGASATLAVLQDAEREEAQRKEEIPGAILRATLDTTHPLGFGLDARLAVLNRTAPILELSADGENVIHYPKENLKVSGFITAESEAKLAQTAYLLRERKGQGFVILFADTPVFRGFWDSTSRLLINAIYFGAVSNPFAD